MLTQLAEKVLSSIPGLEKYGLKVSRGLHGAVLKGGKPTRETTDVLHGTGLGHPLHPIFTDITIGAWTLGAIFDLIGACTDDRYSKQVADTMTTVGTASAVPTLVTGLTDYTTVQKPAMSAATVHALLNDVNFVLYLLSIRERRRGNRSRGIAYSSSAVLLTTISAWLGGHMVYGYKVGVDHSSKPTNLADWAPVMDASELPEREPKRVEVKNTPVLLYRCDGNVHAIDAVCSHAGGPLEQGQFKDCSVQCPWHDSVFDLRDGSIIHGPTTHAQPAFEVREQDGQIEIRQP